MDDWSIYRLDNEPGLTSSGRKAFVFSWSVMRRYERSANEKKNQNYLLGRFRPHNQNHVQSHLFTYAEQLNKRRAIMKRIQRTEVVDAVPWMPFYLSYKHNRYIEIKETKPTAKPISIHRFEKQSIWCVSFARNKNLHRFDSSAMLFENSIRVPFMWM